MGRSDVSPDRKGRNDTQGYQRGDLAWGDLTWAAIGKGQYGTLCYYKGDLAWGDLTRAAIGIGKMALDVAIGVILHGAI